MSQRYRLAQINFARLRVPLSNPKMVNFRALLQAVNSLAEASPGFVWRMDEESAAASGDRARPQQAPGTTLVNLSVWNSVGALQKYANLGTDGGVMGARQSFFKRFEGRWIVLWWVHDGHFPEVAEGWTRLQHLRRHGETPYAFNLVRSFPPPVGAEDYVSRPDNALSGTNEPAGPAMTVRRAGGPWSLGW